MYKKTGTVISLLFSFSFIMFSSELKGELPQNCDTKAVRSYSTFFEWQTACNALPRYDDHKDNPFKTLLDKQDLEKEVDHFFGVITTQLTKTFWVGGKPSYKFYGLRSDIFEPYVQKLFIPPGSGVAVHGDFHGDVHALNSFITTFAQQGYMDKNDPFKITDPSFYMLFLGDYVDRGWYGAEVLYGIMRLKNENPNQVFMVRGNHEEFTLNMRYGFAQEVQKKFSSQILLKKIYRIYNFLPLALYLGSGTYNNYNVIQCCHGGVELGFNPQALLENKYPKACMKIDSLMQADGFKIIENLGAKSLGKFFYNNKAITTTNGFMWNDFIVDPFQLLSRSPRDGYRGAIFEFGKKATQEVLKQFSGKTYTLRSIFRAHQHDHKETPMRKRILNQDRQGHPNDAGAGKLWIEDNPLHKKEPGRLDDVSVVTFSVAPRTGYGWPYHSYGFLTVAPYFKDWYLHIYRMIPRAKL